jgi:hypothetical protein
MTMAAPQGKMPHRRPKLQQEWLRQKQWDNNDGDDPQKITTGSGSDNSGGTQQSTKTSNRSSRNGGCGGNGSRAVAAVAAAAVKAWWQCWRRQWQWQGQTTINKKQQRGWQRRWSWWRQEQSGSGYGSSGGGG